MDADAHDAYEDAPFPVRFEELRPGAQYRVVIDDCCVEAEFTARFERWEPDPSQLHDGAETPAGRTAHFEGGTRLGRLVWFAYPA